MVLGWRPPASTMAPSWEESPEAFIYGEDPVAQSPVMKRAGAVSPESHVTLVSSLFVLRNLVQWSLFLSHAVYEHAKKPKLWPTYL